MFPSWSRKLIIRGTILASVCLVILGGVWAVNGGFRQEQPPTDSPPKSNAEAEPNQPAKETAAAEPAEPRTISLCEAINLLEKAGKGEVVKAEKTGEGTSAQFNLEVLGKDKARTAFNVNATGKVIVENTQPARGSSTGKKTGEKKSMERERSGKGRERKRDDD